jgi:hypothetical protein
VPDIPEAAVKAVAEVMFREYESEYQADHLTWRDFADSARLILEAAAPALAGAWNAPATSRDGRGMDGLAKINANRARIAGHRDADRARRALEVLGERCSQRMRAVAEARIADPEAPWSEIGERLGMTKDQAAGVFWRMMHRAPVRRASLEDDDHDR